MDKNALQVEIANLNPKKKCRRYPPEIRQKIRDYRAQNPHSLERISRDLDLSVITLRRILQENQNFIPIRVREETNALCIRTDALVVEGLSRDDVVYVLKALSC